MSVQYNTNNFHVTSTYLSIVQCNWYFVSFFFEISWLDWYKHVRICDWECCHECVLKAFICSFIIEHRLEWLCYHLKKEREGERRGRRGGRQRERVWGKSHYEHVQHDENMNMYIECHIIKISKWSTHHHNIYGTLKLLKVNKIHVHYMHNVSRCKVLYMYSTVYIQP